LDDYNDVVVAVKTDAKEKEESSTQRLPRELVAKKAKVDSTKQVWFPNNLHSLVAMKNMSSSSSRVVILIQICLSGCC
jgi:hypothetical protein